MFGFMKLPANKIFKQKSVDPGFSASSSTNPFDSDNEETKNSLLNPSRRTSSEPMLITPDFEDDCPKRKGVSSSSSSSSSPYSGSSAPRDRYENNFRDSGGLESQVVQELENYAAYKAEETTKSVNNCLKIAENIREDATMTLDMLHHQGEQITRTHTMAVDMDKDLSRDTNGIGWDYCSIFNKNEATIPYNPHFILQSKLGFGEKLLSNLGGMFSKTWKPKKTKEISGPLITADNSTKRNENRLEQQKERLGIAPVPKGRSATRTPPSETTSALQKVEVEKEKQDDALSDLSNILGDLKNMAFDMGSELDRQNKALDHLSDDADELNSRVKGANQRARRLLGK